MVCIRDASALEIVAPDDNTNSSLPIGWIGAQFLILAGNLRVPKPKKVTLSDVMHFHISKPSGPGSTATGWIPLDPTYCVRNCLMLRFLAPITTKNFNLQIKI
jgi:hypothetical protein